MSDQFLFVLVPYVVAVVVPVAIFVRYLVWRQKHADLQREWLDARRLFGGSRAWRLGLGALLVAHLSSLLLPRQILLWNRVEARLVLLEVTGFLFGVAALIGLLALARRHLADTQRRTDMWMGESALLGVLFVLIVSGLSLAVLYRWASSWSAVTLTPYLASFLHLRPRLELVAQMPYLVKLHMFSAVVALALLPWTRAILLLVYPVHRLLDALVRPPARFAHLLFTRLESWSQRTVLATSIWPEQED